MRRGLRVRRGQRGPLLDAEAMLLVDDGDGERAELDRLLDERVRADRQVGFARRERPQRGRVLRPGNRARHEHAADAELEADRLDRQEVLLRKRLRRRHQGGLVATLDGAEQRVERDDGLAGADVALQEPLHRHVLREVAVDVGDDPLLCSP